MRGDWHVRHRRRKLREAGIGIFGEQRAMIVMHRSGRIIGLIAVLAISVGVFWRTAYPTITWWDSANYSLAAHTLGLTSPPGSLLLTLLGWPVTHLPLGMTPARALNLFAGLLAGVTAALVFVVAIRLRVSSAPATPQ